jgi:Resolvase, N terminal domain
MTFGAIRTTANQERELREVAGRMGCEIVQVYKDHGISGAKGRDKRPAFDRLCRDAAQRKFDLVMAWSVDRLGRSLQDLIGFLSELHALRIDLFLHQQVVVDRGRLRRIIRLVVQRPRFALMGHTIRPRCAANSGQRTHACDAVAMVPVDRRCCRDMPAGALRDAIDNSPNRRYWRYSGRAVIEPRRSILTPSRHSHGPNFRSAAISRSTGLCYTFLRKPKALEAPPLCSPISGCRYAAACGLVGGPWPGPICAAVCREWDRAERSP